MFYYGHFLLFLLLFFMLLYIYISSIISIRYLIKYLKLYIFVNKYADAKFQIILKIHLKRIKF